MNKANIVCCSREWLDIFQANHVTRENNRWAIVVRHNGDVVAWASWTDRRQAFNVVLVYGGPHRPIFGHDGTVAGFLRVVRDSIVDDITPTPCLLWE